MKLLNRQTIVISSLLLLLIIVGVVAYFILQPEEAPLSAPEPTTSSLPTSEDQLRENNSNQQRQTPTRSTPEPTATPTVARPTPLTNEPLKLAVTVTYTNTPQFRLTISDTIYTRGRETASLYAPIDESPYSLLQLISADNSVIAEYEFTIGTQAVLDGITPGGTQQVEESSAYIVLPPASAIQPATVRITSPEGQVLDERPVPQKPLQAAIRIPNQGTALGKLWHTAINALSGKSAQAQQSKFTIAVINEVGSEGLLQRGVDQATIMKDTIEPWSKYADSVEVVRVTNDQSLGCVKVFNIYPRCPYDNLVIQAVEQQAPQWDAIVVMYQSNCNCGSVMVPHFPPIAAVGSNITAPVLVHELGHSVGKMTDEYLYQFGSTTGLAGPNCFPSQSQCLEAIDGYGGAAQCSLGCDKITSWRPATRIMHNSYNVIEFGPLEYCIMDNRLRLAMGLSVEECGVSNEPGSYWGWHR